MRTPDFLRGRSARRSLNLDNDAWVAGSHARPAVTQRVPPVYVAACLGSLPQLERALKAVVLTTPRGPVALTARSGGSGRRGAVSADNGRAELEWQDPVALDYQDELGWTSLHHASRKGFVDCVRTLIAAGAKLDVLDKHGWTPLHHACSKLRIDCVRLLINSGASINLTNGRGNTPLHLANLAVLHGPNPLLELLQEAGASTERPEWLPSPQAFGLKNDLTSLKTH